MDAGNGESRDFRLSQAFALHGGQKGFLRGSRKWMIRLGEKICRSNLSALVRFVAIYISYAAKSPLHPAVS
jgi:hypothetical protein